MAIELLGRIVRTPSPSIVPATAGDLEALDKIKDGKVFAFKGVTTDLHSVAQNNFYWSVLKEVVQHQERYATTTDLHIAIKTRLGYVDEIRLIDGRAYLRVTSTAFDKMEPDERKAFVDAALTVICHEFIPGLHQSALLREVEESQGSNYDALFAAPRRAAVSR